MNPLVTIAVPSLDQGQYLDAAIASLLSQGLPVEIFVADGGSTDNTLAVVEKWSPQLAGWRSHKDAGQSAAINESIARGTAPFVMWLNSDDLLLPGGLRTLVEALERDAGAVAAYGMAWALDDARGTSKPVWVERFSEARLARRCIISQPACLIRRRAWSGVGGVDERLDLAMDYDLWWRLWRAGGRFTFVDKFIATTRLHGRTKTRTSRKRHYDEAIGVVRRHYGRVPIKWFLWRPYSVWAKAIFPGLP